MPIRLLPKYNSGDAQEPEKSGKGIFQKLTEKLKFNKENVEPALGELFGLYDHRCIIFISGKYVGRGYGTYDENRDEDYEEVGKALARI